MANDVCYDHYDHIIAMLVALPTLLCPEEDYGSIEKETFLGRLTASSLWSLSADCKEWYLNCCCVCVRKQVLMPNSNT